MSKEVNDIYKSKKSLLNEYKKLIDLKYTQK